MIFLDFVSKITVFVKKLLPFSEYKNFYQIVNQVIQGHIFWSGLYLQAVKCETGRSRVFFTGNFTHNLAILFQHDLQTTSQGIKFFSYLVLSHIYWKNILKEKIVKKKLGQIYAPKKGQKWPKMTVFWVWCQLFGFQHPQF